MQGDEEPEQMDEVEGIDELNNLYVLNLSLQLDFTYLINTDF